ncbi:3652_t:CDS:2 [Entrophospora sp. SA101]|nr:5432_t:CDS:2 [Entrophospora candida]CAH1760960.1 9348_t:CDS:2 [Entrophospora sp. SA101]CAG8596204.1 11701_t:CDS:2 [Entrophospora candida]CAJ0650284.1 4079_t:CDS:2 [Entrophospora sp. SA101]CAJ0767126.1 3652_t:CDS:2 [Entrophospora sp. SA101]
MSEHEKEFPSKNTKSNEKNQIFTDDNDDNIPENIKEIIIKDSKILPKFWIDKYKNETCKNWDLFYRRNTTKFFKNRNWIGREFIELNESSSQKIVLELGCGVGNFLFPVLESNSNLFIYACDFSKRAIDFVKLNQKYDEKRCKAFVCDLTKDSLSQYIINDKIDIVSAIFVFSAMPPENHLNVIKNIAEVTKPGSVVCFRDYALYDETQLKFSNSKSNKLQDNLYVRQDGTLSYFFSKKYLKETFESNSLFKNIDMEYVYRETINRAKSLCVERRFLQAKFIRL